MVIDRFYDIFTNDQATLNKSVTNNSDQTLYLKVTLASASNVFGQETDHTLNPEQMAHSLLVLNQAVIIPPHESKNVKFYLPEGHPKKEAFYRVNFTPVIPTLSNGFDVKLSRAKIREIKAAANLSIGISTFVVVNAKGAKSDHVSVLHNGSSAIVKDTGNTPAVVSLSGYVATPAQGKKRAKPHVFSGVSLILPGHKIKVPLNKFSGDVLFSVSYNPASQHADSYRFRL